jgi:hypothetical protein
MSERIVGEESEAGLDAHEELTQEVAFQALCNERRRGVIHYLHQRGESVTLRDLSVQITAWEEGIDPEAVTGADRRSVYNALQQVHLPQMDESGLVEYDKSRGTVAPTADLERVNVYLEVDPVHDSPWSVRYLLASGLSVALSVAVWLDLPVLGRVGAGGVLAFVVALFTASALAHVYYTRQAQFGGDGPPPGFDAE